MYNEKRTTIIKNDIGLNNFEKRNSFILKRKRETNRKKIKFCLSKLME